MASIVLALFVQTHIDPTADLGLAVTAAYVLGFPPFAFASWIVVRSLRERPAQAGTLYAADLAGAGGGNFLAPLRLSSLRPPGLYGLAPPVPALHAALCLSSPAR